MDQQFERSNSSHITPELIDEMLGSLETLDNAERATLDRTIVLPREEALSAFATDESRVKQIFACALAGAAGFYIPSFIFVEGFSRYMAFHLLALGTIAATAVILSVLSLLALDLRTPRP